MCALLVIVVPFSILLGFIARRKGQNVPLWVIIGLIPGLNGILPFYLVSLTDKAVLEQLNALALLAQPTGDSAEDAM